MKLLNAFACTVMRFWQDALDSLNTDGGHILLLAIMVWLGMLGLQVEMPKADELFIGAFTALLILLKSAGSNKTRRDRPSPESSTIVEATTAGPKPPDVNIEPKPGTVTPTQSTTPPKE
jgi:hypothetical protein